MRLTVMLWILWFAAVAFAGNPEDSVVKENRTKFFGDRRSETTVKGGWGTGTVVASGGGESLVLTNKHVAPTGDAFYFVLHDGMSYQARWVGADEKADLALLRIDAALPAAALAAAEPKAGAGVRMWGCLHNGPMLARSGRVDSDADNHRDADQYPYLRTRMPGGHGDSGSGMFDADGRLFAVLYGGPADEADNWNMCVRLADVRRFLGRHK